MTTIIRPICLIVLLIPVVAVSLPRTMIDRAKIIDRFSHSIEKHQVNNVFDCSWTFSFLSICRNHTYGNMSFCIGYPNECNTVTVDAYLNQSNNNDVCQTHNYNGHVRIDDPISGISKYKINFNLSICHGTYNGTGVMCDKDCEDFSVDGEWGSMGDNTTCHSIDTAGAFCFP